MDGLVALRSTYPPKMHEIKLEGVAVNNLAKVDGFEVKVASFNRMKSDGVVFRRGSVVKLVGKVYFGTIQFFFTHHNMHYVCIDLIKHVAVHASGCLLLDCSVVSRGECVLLDSIHLYHCILLPHLGEKKIVIEFKRC